MNRQTQFALMLADLATTLGDQSTPVRLNKMAEVLAGAMTDEEFRFACEQVALNELRLPPPAKFLEYGKGSSRHEAERAVGAILTAIRRIGYARQSEARAALGEPTWRAVERMGGWIALCENTDPPGVLRKQLLDCCLNTHQDNGREQALAQLGHGAGRALELVESLATRKALK